MRVTEKVADPMSNAAPPTDDTSMSSSRTLARITAGRPRKPSVQNRLSRSVRSVGRNGMSAPEARFMLKPAPFSATKRSPPLISCTTPAITSPIVGAGRGGTAAMLTQAISKPAAAGFEMACVSIAAVPPLPAPTMGDVIAGVVQEIKGGDLFVAEKGAGFSMKRASGADIPFLPTERTDLESLFWTLGFRGRPAVILASVLEELIDVSSVGGAAFDIGSATFSVTRILTGQLDAYVDIGPAIIEARPWVEAEFRRVGRGNVLCNSPYDLAAVHVLCREAGVPIGDAAGRPLDDKPVLGPNAEYQLACIAAGNQELQDSLIEVVQRGIRDLRDLRTP